MAQLLLISERCPLTTGNQQPGDVVAVFPDTHKFSALEQTLFDIVTVAESQASIEAMRPVVKTMVRASSIDWVDEQDLERCNAWVDKTGAILEVKEAPRYPLSYQDGKVVETYSRIPLNTESVLKEAIGSVRA